MATCNCTGECRNGGGCGCGRVYGFPAETRAEELRRRYAFFAPTFVVCTKCGEESPPGFDHQCREDSPPK